MSAPTRGVDTATIPSDLPALTSLFRAYAAPLPIDLGNQGFDGELASLPGKYAPSAGILALNALIALEPGPATCTTTWS